MSQTPIRRLAAREPEFLSTLDALLAFEAEADGRIDAAVTEILQALDLLTDLEAAFRCEIPDWELQGVTTLDGLAAVIRRRR